MQNCSNKKDSQFQQASIEYMQKLISNPKLLTKDILLIKKVVNR